MEWVAMPFGLCNAPTSFQRMMSDNLREFLHKLVTVIFDDICVDNRTLDEHMEHLRIVLQLFKEACLKLRLESVSSVFMRWSTWATQCLLGKCQFRHKKSRPLHTSHCLRRIRNFAFSLSFVTSTPSSSTILATLRVHCRTNCGSPSHRKLR
jgi:hypothetical protein